MTSFQSATKATSLPLLILLSTALMALFSSFTQALTLDQCTVSLAGLLSNADLNQCMPFSSLSRLLTEEVTPELVNSTATDFCVYPDCSQQAIALVQNTIVQNCLDGVDVPNDTTTANIVYGVASLYPPLKQGICTRIPNNGTFCVTEFAKSLGDYIRANPSPLGIGIFLNGTVLFDYVSKIPKEVLCTDCTEAIVTPISNFVEKNMLSLRPEIVSWALTAKKATTDKCGATFLDGDIPSFNKGNNSKNDNQPKGAAASLSKSAMQTWNVFSALLLVILALLPL
ncbi:hypothetical protein BGW41_001065 [Actinomortierella wolfii]|nr:hypothetical protein BGW41_001065 [Actinomortierella wolfii]